MILSIIFIIHNWDSNIDFKVIQTILFYLMYQLEIFNHSYNSHYIIEDSIIDVFWKISVKMIIKLSKSKILIYIRNNIILL